MWYTSSCGRVEFEITKEQAYSGSHSGPCDADIAALRTVPKIRRQLNKINSEVLKEELRGYGAWDDNELLDHNLNLDRILWLACNDIVDNLHTR